MSAIAMLRRLCRVSLNGSKIGHVKAFHSAGEAKEFLISHIVAEARRENIPLSEVERKMLYFTESGWTLPDMMHFSEDFDRNYDQNDYERKIAKLVRNVDRRIGKDSPEEYCEWWAAIRFLQREDHYISVMIRVAGLRPRGDQLRLLLTALGIVAFVLIWIFFSIKYNIHMPSRGEFEIFVWVVLLCLSVAYTLARFVLGNKRTDDFTSKVLEKVVRLYQRVTGSA